MGVGRKPIPDELKRLRGTAQPSRLRPNALKAATVNELPEPPEWLGEIAKTEWRDKTAELFGMGILAKADFSLLAALCNEWEIYQLSEVELKKTGRYFVTRDEETGEVVKAAPVPSVRIGKEALEKYIQLSGEFGFTPAARLKIQISPKAEKSEFEKLFEAAGQYIPPGKRKNAEA